MINNIQKKYKIPIKDEYTLGDFLKILQKYLEKYPENINKPLYIHNNEWNSNETVSQIIRKKTSFVLYNIGGFQETDEENEIEEDYKVVE